MAPKRKHIFMAAVTLSFRKEDSVSRISTNMFIHQDNRQVNLDDIDHLRLATLQRSSKELGITVNDIVDFFIMGVSYLGHMSEEEFSPQSKTKANPYDA